MRLVHRLLLGAVLAISGLVILTVILSGQRLRRQLEGASVDELTREARLVASVWTPAARPTALAHRAATGLGTPVVLADRAGRVVGDSRVPASALSQLPNVALRPEVAAALRGRIGVARTSDVAAPRPGDELAVAVPAPLGVVRVSMRTAQLDRIVGRARRDVLLSGLVALAVVLVLAAIFAREISRPVVELRDVARALAAGDLSRRPALSAPGELGDLGAALARMSEQLAGRLAALEADDDLMAALLESLREGVVAVDARRRIVRANGAARRLLGLPSIPCSADQLPRDRAVREALAAALAGAPTEPAEIQVDGRTLALAARPLAPGGAVLTVLDLTATRHLETVRRDFVANVSHELRTPLTVIGGFAETLASDDVPDSERHRFAQAIHASAVRMQRLVRDLLDLSRIESGGWRPSPTSVALRAAAAEAVAPCRAAADEKGVVIVIALDAEIVQADPTALHQVLGNLVANAVQYTERGGRVTVFAHRRERGVWLGVRDTGVGIAPEHLPRIFERFYRADAARAREGGGTGLGLAIVRHLVEAHGGQVRAESTVGQGTTISAFFPDAPVRDAAASDGGMTGA